MVGAARRTIFCRICVTKLSEKELCAHSRTEGCPEVKEVVKTLTEAEKANADATPLFRGMVPKSIMEDVTVLQQKLLARIQEEPSIRKTEVLAVEVLSVAGSVFKEATVYTKRFSGIEDNLAIIRRLQVKVAGKLITFYNSKMYDITDVDRNDKPREYTDEEMGGEGSGDGEPVKKTTTPSPSKAVNQAKSEAAQQKKDVAKLMKDFESEVDKIILEDRIKLLNAKLADAKIAQSTTKAYGAFGTRHFAV